jgi:endonuclease/exonuclease/phosphatase family metal-dependent hydrolase
VRPGLTVATHNLMHGRGLAGLLPRYRALGAALALEVVCLQEDGRGPRGLHGRQVARALGPSFVHLSEPDDPSVSLVIDGARLRVRHCALVPLPRLGRLSWFERRFIAGGRTTQRHALIAVLEPRDAPAIAVASFHLETAGDNAHRRAQVAALGEALRRRAAARVVACGDTNCFAIRRGRHAAVLDEVLAPLGARPCGPTGPTHYFARGDEPLLPHQLGVLLGRFGLDWPLRYDVVCTDLPVTAHGQEHTPESDHDLVWARLTVA